MTNATEDSMTNETTEDHIEITEAGRAEAAAPPAAAAGGELFAGVSPRTAARMFEALRISSEAAEALDLGPVQLGLGDGADGEYRLVLRAAGLTVASTSGGVTVGGEHRAEVAARIAIAGFRVKERV